MKLLLLVALFLWGCSETLSISSDYTPVAGKCVTYENSPSWAAKSCWTSCWDACGAWVGDKPCAVTTILSAVNQAAGTAVTIAAVTPKGRLKQCGQVK